MSKTVSREVSIGDVGTQGAIASEQAEGSRMALNVGPSHPTTHGVLRLIMELDGDVIAK
ncbi:MAG TPA: NADH-quinone oxidoreductase subunit D, partial [Opitutae bacterium]|nr:NADH-quinone oxidoreductase subunit D [Opitutae bacterium]